MKSIEIRKARRDDIERIISMCKDSLAATYGDFMDEEAMRPWIAGTETDDYVRSRIAQMLVAEFSGRIAGVVSLDQQSVDLLWVDIDHRRQGIGRCLMERAERELASSGHSTGKLECFEPNRDAIAFYERLGWSIERKYLDETAGVNKVVMTKTLSAA